MRHEYRIEQDKATGHWRLLRDGKSIYHAQRLADVERQLGKELNNSLEADNELLLSMADLVHDMSLTRYAAEPQGQRLLTRFQEAYKKISRKQHDLLNTDTFELKLWLFSIEPRHSKYSYFVVQAPTEEEAFERLCCDDSVWHGPDIKRHGRIEPGMAEGWWSVENAALWEYKSPTHWGRK